MTEGHLVDVGVGRLIRLRRLELGLSREELGAGIGCTFQQVQKYEKGSNRVSASRLARIANVLMVPPVYFFREMPAELGDLDEYAVELNLVIGKLSPEVQAIIVHLVTRLAEESEQANAKKAQSTERVGREVLPAVRRSRALGLDVQSVRRDKRPRPTPRGAGVDATPGEASMRHPTSQRR